MRCEYPPAYFLMFFSILFLFSCSLSHRWQLDILDAVEWVEQQLWTGHPHADTHLQPACIVQSGLWNGQLDQHGLQLGCQRGFELGNLDAR